MKSNKLTYTLIIVAVGIAAALAVFQDTSISSAQPVVIKPVLPPTPSEAPIMNTVVEKRSADAAASIAQDVFGVAGQIMSLPNGYLIAGGSKEVWLFDNGAVKYITAQWSNPNYETDTLDRGTLVSIAEQYIAKLRSKGLLPSDPGYSIQLEDVRGGSETVAMTQDGIIVGKKVHYMDVFYTQRFMGKEIWGGANDVRVSIGKGGEVIAFYGYWRQGVQGTNVPVKVTAEQALDSVISTRNFGVRAELPPLEKIVIDKMDLVYWAEIPEDIADLTPYWGIKGTLVGTSGEKINFMQKVPIA